MRAIVQQGYGTEGVYHLQQVDTPTPAEDEVMVRVHAASLHPDIWHVMTGLPYALRLMGSGLRRPKPQIPGTDMAGVVEAVGARVTTFQPGDAVFGETLTHHQWTNGGTFAELVSVKADQLALKPAGITFEAAATIPTAGIIALHSLHIAGGVQAGQEVLINGAAGGVGALALQIAKARGAKVTAVDHTAKLDLLWTLGADQVLDYTRSDFTRGEARYDLILDIPGNHPFSACRRALKPHGTYLLIGHGGFDPVRKRLLGPIPHALGLTLLGWFVPQLPKPDFSMPDRRVLIQELARLLADRKLTPVPHRTFPLEQVSEAMHCLRSGEAVGRILLTP